MLHHSRALSLALNEFRYWQKAGETQYKQMGELVYGLWEFEIWFCGCEGMILVSQ